MFSGARPAGGFSAAADAGRWVDMRANPDSAASLDRAAPPKQHTLSSGASQMT